MARGGGGCALVRAGMRVAGAVLCVLCDVRVCTCVRVRGCVCWCARLSQIPHAVCACFPRRPANDSGFYSLSGSLPRNILNEPRGCEVSRDAFPARGIMME